MLEYESHLRDMGIESTLFFRVNVRDGKKFFELCVQDSESVYATGREFSVEVAEGDREEAVADTAVVTVMQWVSDSLKGHIDWEQLKKIEPEKIQIQGPALLGGSPHE